MQGMKDISPRSSVDAALTSLTFGFTPSGKRKIYWAMAPLLVPRHIRWPEDDIAIAVTTSFLSERGAYSTCELVWSPLTGQTWITPAAEQSIMEAHALSSSSDRMLVGTDRTKLGAVTDIDRGLICRCIWMSNTLIRGSGTYCCKEKGNHN